VILNKWIKWCDDWFCVSLVGLKHAQISGKTLFLGMPVKMLLEEISIWIHRLSKEDLPSPKWAGLIHWCPEKNPKHGRRTNTLFLSWGIYLSLSVFSSVAFLALGLLNLYHHSPNLSNSWVFDSDWNLHLWFLGFSSLCNGTVNLWLVFLNVYMHLNISYQLFLWRSMPSKCSNFRDEGNQFGSVPMLEAMWGAGIPFTWDRAMYRDSKIEKVNST
jgi:hypothetical protein